MEDPFNVEYGKQSAEQSEAAEVQKTSSNLPITELGLSTRASNVLLSAGVRTVADALAALEEGDAALTNLKGFGPKSLAELKQRLRTHGFRPVTEVTLPSEALEAIAVRKEAQEEVGAVAAEAALEEQAPEAAAPVAVEAVSAEKAPEAAAPVAVEAAPEDKAPAAAAEAPTEFPSTIQRLKATLDQARGRLGGSLVLHGMIGLLILVALFLPPVSLLERMGIIGYTTLNAKSDPVSHPDGLTLSVDPETFTERLRVRLESVPRLEFLEGSAGAGLRKAVEALPGHLVVKSPYYRTKVRGDTSQPVMIDASIPNDADPWETLDLYTWTSGAWEWVGSELHTEVAEREFIRAQVTDPDSIVVVQAGPITPTIHTYLGPNDELVAAAAGMLDEVNSTGLLLGTDGGFVGDVDSLQQPAVVHVLPTLRNWAPGATVNRGLLLDMLSVPEIQQTHIANIVQLCIEWGFAGVELDYRGVTPELRDAYSAFTSALADDLHAEGLRLNVVVEPPTPTDGGWDTGGYDWASLGAAADVVKVPFPEDPAAYVEGGQAHRLLDWATAQVSRYKLRMLVSSLSAERSSKEVNYISLERAVAPFGEAMALDDINQIEPGSQVEFGLSGRLLSITPQEAAGTYRLEYEANDGEIHTVWLGTAANLATKLRWAQRYHLGGIAVADMLDPGNAEGIVDTVASYRTTVASPATQEPEIAWMVSSAAATVDQQTSPLTEPGYNWMVLTTSGTYTVSATVAGFNHGSVEIFVGQPEPVVTELITEEMITETEEVTATGVVTPTLALATTEVETDTLDCLDAVYMADVTIPDDTQLDNEEAFEKTWRVRNNGTCAWPEDTVLAFASGAQMDAPQSVEVGTVEPGENVTVSLKMKAPAEPGRYTGVWQMQTADGFFGGNLTVVIQAGEVEEEVGAGEGEGGGEEEAPAPAPPPVSGGSFELGGHILGYDYASQMHHAGMNWVKVQVRYAGDATGVINEAHANGFKILLGALGGPQDVTKASFINDYANWFASLAAAGADAIEVWNEPNIEREWQQGHIDPAAYTRLLCAAYSAIKGANPNTLVVSGALSPTWHNPPYHWGDDVFLQGMAAAGAASCMDYVGAHYNSGIVPPSQRSGSSQGEHYSWYFWPMVDLYYGSFGGARQVVFTEMGYLSPEGYCQLPDNFLWAANTTVAQQTQWLAEAASQAAASGRVRLIIVWNVGFYRYDCGPGYGDPQAGYSIIRPGRDCPACNALHDVLGSR